MELTITLPDRVYQRAKEIARLTGESVNDVIASMFEEDFSLPDRDFPNITGLSDDIVLRLAEATMDETQNARLSDLLYAQQAGKLSAADRIALDALMDESNYGLLLKAYALAEAVQRGLRPPLEP